MTPTNSLQKNFFIFSGAVVLTLALFFALLPMPARAAELSEAQIQSVINLVAAFGADQATIEKVTKALYGNGLVLGASTQVAAIAPLPGDTHQFSVEYSSTQGANRWYYQVRTGTTYTNMLWDTANNWWQGSGGTPIIKATRINPGATTDAALKWLAPKAGAISITGTIKDLNSTCGDAVGAFILKNANILWSEQIANATTTAKTHSTTTTVAAGDAIYFLVTNGPADDYRCDATNWDPTITYAPVDTTAPSVSLTTPSAGTVKGTVKVSATASDNVGVEGVEFRYGNTLIGDDTTAPYSVNWDTVKVPNGSYALSAIARDAAGNRALSNRGVMVANPPDITPPVVTLISPVNNPILSGASYVLAATSSDNVGVVGVQFKLDGANLGTEKTTNFWHTWSLTGVTSGVHTITAVARDAAGNKATSSAKTVTVDKSAATKHFKILVGTINMELSESLQASKFAADGIVAMGASKVATNTIDWKTTNIALHADQFSMSVDSQCLRRDIDRANRFLGRMPDNVWFYNEPSNVPLHEQIGLCPPGSVPTTNETIRTEAQLQADAAYVVPGGYGPIGPRLVVLSRSFVNLPNAAPHYKDHVITALNNPNVAGIVFEVSTKTPANKMEDGCKYALSLGKKCFFQKSPGKAGENPLGYLNELQSTVAYLANVGGILNNPDVAFIIPGYDNDFTEMHFVSKSPTDRNSVEAAVKWLKAYRTSH